MSVRLTETGQQLWDVSFWVGAAGLLAAGIGQSQSFAPLPVNVRSRQQLPIVLSTPTIGNTSNFPPFDLYQQPVVREASAPVAICRGALAIHGRRRYLPEKAGRPHGWIMAMNFDKILKATKETFRIVPSPALEDAFRALPRTNFSPRIYDDRQSEWVTNNEGERWTYLVGEDRYLPLAIDSEGAVTASITQPSLQLAMIEKLQLEPGQRVLEIGAGSGWSAALMSKIVGQTGKVVSVEIDPELAHLAEENLEKNGISNVRVIWADGALDVDEAPFDRIIYTVGARQFPKCLFRQLEADGKVVLIHKFDETADIFYEGSKDQNGDIVLQPVMPVIFVEMQGALEERDQVYALHDIASFPISGHFWGDTDGTGDLLHRTAGLRFFLRAINSLDYTQFSFKDKRGFGLQGTAGTAVALAGTCRLTGDREQCDVLKKNLVHWMEFGMPGMTAFNLKISERPLRCEPFGFFAGGLRYDYYLIDPPEIESRPKLKLAS